MPLQNATNGTKQIVGIPVNGSPTNNQTLLFGNNQINWGTFTWGQITGTLSDQSDLNTRFTNIDTAISGKQTNITLGTVSQYFKGNLTLSDFATDVRNILLTGLTINNNSAVVATDSLLTALNKLQSQINNIPIGSGGTTTTTLTIGGDNVSSDRSIGNNTNYSFSIETNNIPYFEFNKNGFLNIWANSRYAVNTNNIPAGALVLSDRTRNFGWGTSGWSSPSLCQQLFEFDKQTEVLGECNGIGLVSFWAFKYNSYSPNKEFVIGRNTGYGRQDLIRLCSRSILHGFEDVDMNTSTSPYYMNDDNKRNFIIQGQYPSLWLVSKDSGNTTHSNVLKFAHHTGTNTARHFHIGQLNEGRRFAFSFYEGSDWNPHNGLNYNGRVGLMITTNNNSPNNSLGDSFGMCLNVHDYNNMPYFNLHILGSNTNNGTIGWGLNNGISRTDILIDANASANYLDRQSGFFTPGWGYGGSSTAYNYFPEADGNSLLIQCRHPNGGNGFQIGTRIDRTNRFFIRTNNNTWQEILLHNGNNIGSTLKIGTQDGYNLQFIRSNSNVMEFISNNQIIFQNEVIFGTTSIPRILEFNSSNRQILVNNQDGFGTASRPSYSFRGYEDRGMYLESSNKLCFSVASYKRLAIDHDANRIEAIGFPFKSDQGYYVGNDLVINSKHSTTINTLSGSASLNDVITLLNTLISTLKNHHKLFS